MYKDGIERAKERLEAYREHETRKKVRLALPYLMAHALSPMPHRSPPRHSHTHKHTQTYSHSRIYHTHFVTSQMAWMEVEVERHQQRLERQQMRQKQQREMGLVQAGMSPISPRQTPRPPVSPRDRDAQSQKPSFFPTSPHDPRFEVSTTMDGPGGFGGMSPTSSLQRTPLNDHTRSRMSPHELDTDHQ